MSTVTTFEFNQRLSGRFQLPARMSVLPLGAGKIAVISPIPMDDALAHRVSAQGEVAFLISPNLYHHLYLGDAARRFPQARVLASPGLRAKRPDLSIHGTLDQPLPPELAAAVEVMRLEGAPGIDEHVFFHRESRTLVVTDLVFNVVEPRGFMAHLILFLVGCHGRLGHSRFWNSLVKDELAFAHSLERMLSWPFQTLIVAHGEMVRDAAQGRLAEALRRRLPARAALVAG